MTVKTQEFVIEYTGDASTTVFALDYPFLEQAHLVAVKYTAADPNTLIPVTIASVTGAGLDAGWGVTLSAPVGVGYTLRVSRVTPLTQERDYVPNDPFAAKSHELGLDKLTMILQEMRAIGVGGATGGPTFTEGPELELIETLPPRTFGYASDTKTFIYKLGDGTVVRVPTDNDSSPALSGYMEGGYSESNWVAQTGNILGKSSYIRGENLFSHELFAQGMALRLRWVAEISDLSASSYTEFSFGGNPCGQFDIVPTGTQLLNVEYECLIYANSWDDTSVSLFAQSSVRYSKNYADPAATETEAMRYYSLGSYVRSGESSVSLLFRRGDSGYVGNDFRQLMMTASFENIGASAPGAQLIGTAGGDLDGTYPDPTVVGIRGKAVPTLSAGFFVYSGTAWEFLPLNSMDFVKKTGDTMTGRLEFGAEGGAANGRIKKTADLGFNYLDIEQVGQNAHIALSTENNSGKLTTKMRVGPEGMDFLEPVSADTISANGVSARYCDHVPGSAPDQAKARTFWNSSRGVLSTYLREAGSSKNTTVEQGEIVKLVRNETGATIPNGSPVRVLGSTGDQTTIVLASATTAMAGDDLYITTEDIATGESGYVVKAGELFMDTSAWAPGTVLYFSATLGQFASTPPVSDGATVPAKVVAARVVRQHATEGRITVHIDRIPFEHELSLNGVTLRTGTSAVASMTKYTVYRGTGGHTEALPPFTGSHRSYWYKNSGSGDWVIQGSGTGTIRSGTTVVTSITLPPGQSAHIVDAENLVGEAM